MSQQKSFQILNENWVCRFFGDLKKCSKRPKYKVVSIGLFLSRIVHFRTMKYVRSYSSFLLVKKVPMEMESYISLRRTMFCTLSLGKNTSLGKDTQTQNKPMETTYSADPKSGCAKRGHKWNVPVFRYKSKTGHPVFNFGHHIAFAI